MGPLALFGLLVGGGALALAGPKKAPGAGPVAAVPNPFGWPESPAGRSAAVLAAVLGGGAEFAYATIRASADGMMAEIPIFGDALKINGVRINADMATQEKIARHLGAFSPTTKIADLVFAQADTRIPPQNQSWYSGMGGDGSMATTRRMFDYSAIVDRALSRVGGFASLLDNAGKFWVLDAAVFAPGMNVRGGIPWQKTAPNYGWKTSAGNLLQPLGFAHNLGHSDYSQVIRLVGPAIKVSLDGGSNWTEIPTETAYTNPSYSKLVSYATLPAASHPGV